MLIAEWENQKDKIDRREYILANKEYPKGPFGRAAPESDSLQELILQEK